MSLSVAEHLVHRGVSVEDGAHAVLTHRTHAELARLLTDDERRRLAVDEFADRIGDAQILENGLTPLVAGAVTPDMCFPASVDGGYPKSPEM